MCHCLRYFWVLNKGYYSPTTDLFLYFTHFITLKIPFYLKKKSVLCLHVSLKNQIFYYITHISALRIFVFSYLTYFTEYDNLLVHPCCCKWHHFILFYGWVIYHCTYVPHLYPIHCWWTFIFHILATVNSAAMNIRMQVSFQIMVFQE